MKGTVVKIFGRYYTVEHNGQRLNSVLRGRMRKDKLLDIYSEAVAVGDVVEFDIENGRTCAIERVYDRRNVLSRKYKDSDREDLIASNLDQIVVVQSFHEPDINERFVDRILVRGIKENIPTFLCMNKLDLSGPDDVERLYSYYKGYDLDIVRMSAITGAGLDDLKDRLIGRLSILIGNSGVGKTSVINALYPDLQLRTRDISESTGKGRHTTTNVEMLGLEHDIRIIDTPGLREFGLPAIEPRELGACFMEFSTYGKLCGFQPCTHEHEPGCEVKRLVEEGALSQERYISYLHILSTLKDYYDNRYR